jgi:hypothetical protein
MVSPELVIASEIESVLAMTADPSASTHLPA